MVGKFKRNQGSQLSSPKKRRTRQFESLEARCMLDASPIITELMASNSQTLDDGFGESSDWVEIFNAGDQSLDLAGWYLTDDVSDLTQWQFPSVQLGAGERLVVFASGFDAIDPDGNLHTSFGLSSTGDYLALVNPDQTTIVSEFNAGGVDFPVQDIDISYGIEEQLTSLVVEGADGKALVPIDNSLASTWTGGNEGTFSDATWTDVTTGVGYDSKAGDSISAGSSMIAYYNFDVNEDDQSDLLMNYPGTFENGATVSGDIPGVGGVGSLELDGGGAHFLIPAMMRPSLAYTYSFWFKPASSLTSSSGRMDLVYGLREDGTQPTPHFTINRSSHPDGTLRNFIHDDHQGSVHSTVASTATTWTADWHHAAFTFDGTTHRVFIDGVLDDSTDDPGIQQFSKGLVIGMRDNGSSPFSGNIDEVAVFSTALDFEVDGSGNLTGGDVHTLFTVGASPLVPNDVLNVDIGTDTNGTQAGYTQWNAGPNSTEDVIPTKTFTEFGGFTATITDEKGGTVDVRERALEIPGDAFLHEVLRDGVKDISGTLNLTFSDLAPGEYEITSLIHDPQNRADEVEILIQDADRPVSEQAIEELRPAENAVLGDTLFRYATTRFRTDGSSDVVITYYAESSSTVVESVLTGFSLTPVGDETLDHLINPAGNIQPQLEGVNSSAYLRIPFDINDLADIDYLQLNMKYDDGFVAYINGVEVASSNAPGTLTFDSTATAEHPNQSASVAESFYIHPGSLNLQTTDNILAIHGLNVSAADEDFLISPELVGVKIDGTPIGYFASATPGEANTTPLAAGFVEDTQFSIDRGIYDAPINVEITSLTPDADIYYTTDGSDPNDGSDGNPVNGTLYTAALTISSTTTLRAAAFKAGLIPTNVDTHTYLFLDDVLTQSLPAGTPGGFDFEMDPEVVNANAGSAAEVTAALESLPTLSIVMDADDLFGDDGVYFNGRQGSEGGNNRLFERGTSVELIYPDQPEFASFDGFQIDAGLQPNGNLRVKHSLSLEFKSKYGDSQLEYPIFESAPLNADSAVNTFDKLALRAGSQMGWATGFEETIYTRDQWVRDTQIAMSGVGQRGTFVHLYLNGSYFGLYNMTEEADTDFTSDYLGGDPEDYFGTKARIERQPYAIIDGDRTRYDEMISIAEQRELADTQSFVDFQEYIDIDKFIDYVGLMWYAGTGDMLDNNWFGGMRNDPTGQFMFFQWDAELSFSTQANSSGNADPAGNTAGVAWVQPNFIESWREANPNNVGNETAIIKLWAALWDNEDFRVQFADRMHMHLSDGGALSDAASLARLNTINDFVEDAIVAESARWGDGYSNNAANPPRTKTGNWDPNVALVEARITGNADVLIAAMQAENFYPDTQSPITSPTAGTVLIGSSVDLSNPNVDGTIYYTTDGSDPKLSNSQQTVQLVGPQMPATVLVPVDGSLGTTWTGDAGDEPFDDSLWTSAEAAIGFNTENSELLQVDIGPEVQQVQAGWTEWSITGALGLIDDPGSSDLDPFAKTFTEFGGFDALITHSSGDVEDLIDVRTRARIGNQMAGNLSELAVDGAKDSSLRLTLNNLAAGVYEITLYDHDARNGNEQNLYSVTDADRTAELIKSIRLGHTYNSSYMPWVTIAFRSDGVNPVFFEIDTPGPASTEEAFINGFEMRKLTTDAYHSTSGDIETEMSTVNSSIYQRIPFEVNDLANINSLFLNMTYDDGFVAYLNGVEVASANAPGRDANPGTLEFNSVAAASQADVDLLTPTAFDLTTSLGLLQAGTNILAIQGLNASSADGDFLIAPELSAGYGLADGLSSDAIEFTTSITINESTVIKSRVLSPSGEWSPLAEDLFVIEVPLRITELMYNPNGSDDLEFVELINTSASSIPLAGIRFDGSSEGIEFTFDNSELALGPGERIVVVKDAADFALKYDGINHEIDSSTIRIATGEYSGKLSNDGETVTLLDAAGGLIQQFTYNDAPWYKETDGDDFSLVVIDTSGDYNDPANWRSSAKLGGSPGLLDPVALVADFNGDGIVDRGDLRIILSNYGKIDVDGSGDNDVYRFTGDANNDNKVSLDDLLLAKQTFGDTVEIVSAPIPAAAAASLVVSIESESESLTQTAVQKRVAKANVLTTYYASNKEQRDALPILPVRSISASERSSATDQVFTKPTTKTATSIRSALSRRIQRRHKAFSDEINSNPIE